MIKRTSPWELIGLGLAMPICALIGSRLFMSLPPPHGYPTELKLLAWLTIPVGIIVVAIGVQRLRAERGK